MDCIQQVFFNYKKIIIDTHTYIDTPIDTHTQTIKDSYGARTWLIIIIIMVLVLLIQ